jgi:cell division protein FtsL
LIFKKGTPLNRRTFIAFFVGIHLCFIVLLIHKQSLYIGLTFEKQRLEKQKQDLSDQKDRLSQELLALNNKSDIKKYATDQLNMKQLTLSNLITGTQHE